MHLVSSKNNGLFKSLFMLMVLLVLTSSITFAQTELSTSQENGKLKVLILNSYEPQNPWTQVQEEGIIKSLESKISTTKIYREYMDSKRMYGESYDAQFSDYLKNKYKDKDIQLIITTDDYATKFVQSHKTQFANLEVPVVFFWIK